MHSDPGAGPVPPAPARDRKERILDALGDPIARQVLLMLNEAAHSAQDLVQTNHVPQSTLYRRLHDLQELGLVAVQRSIITRDGKRVDLYRSLLEELTVELKGDKLLVGVKFRSLSAERMRELWIDVRKEASGNPP